MLALRNRASDGERPDRHKPTATGDSDPLEVDIRRYRRWRDRRREAERHRARQPKLGKEVEDILDFARTWAPFGGPPEDEIFVNFGMCPSRFAERLWHIIGEFGCEPADETQWQRAYPLHD
ncbi:hypothetical protein [Rhodococcus jostii]|uniref:DUF3263 domain-containing protein n=1 Tax=Rhodococcus jostii TaxID=132919 RepID=A0A1H5CUX7_RHOJO|nr:hypothetical protein [Rhodococcus jostii]SED70476.1 hypothetical protein SAMN04490220_5268 [Rhodococcus jostii]